MVSLDRLVEDSAIDSYLIPNWPCRFEFLRIGELCNGSRSFSFSDAFCDLEYIPGAGLPYAINFRTIFDRGFQILEAQKPGGESIKMSQEETRAMESLNKFIFNIRTHEKCLLNALEKIKTEPSKETVLSMALAEHLFSPLASGYSYIIDSRAQGKRPNKICKCGCNSPVKFDATGMGHSKVWHGYADIIIKDENHSPVETVMVVANPIGLDPGEDSGPSTAKKLKTEDDESVGMSSISEVKLKIEDNWDQAVAQTIVFASAQRRLKPCRRTFIPNIMICQKEFYIIMYDPENDVLVWSGKYQLWNEFDPSTLNKGAIITLWMVIHYKLFCSGGDILKNEDTVKAGFLNHIRDGKKEYYKQLAVGVSNFHTEEKFLCQNQCNYMFVDIEAKLKKHTTS